MFPRREKFPSLNNYHDLKHITHELHKSGIKDEEVISIAKRQQRIIITKNIKHFYERCRIRKVDVLGISEIVTPEELDKKIMANLKKRRIKKMTGKLVSITQK